jgi:hypothetical protein
MINRKQLTNGNIQFQDFARSSHAPIIGQQQEVPMNAFGSVIARYEVISVEFDGVMFTAEAKRVA